MPFVNGIWIEPDKKQTEKHKIIPSQVNLHFTLGRAVNKTYRVVYMVIIQDKMSMSTGALPLQNRFIDQESLKSSIIASIEPVDRDYMKLVKFSSVSATFEFNWNKWFNDSLKNVRPNNRLAKFEQTFKFKKQVPKMIAFSTTRNNFDKFILRKFKVYMEKNRKARTWFEKFLPREISGKIRLGISTMFDYEFNWQTNSIVAKLKPVYVMGILFSISAIASTKKQDYIKVDFSKSVKRKAKNFNRKKWKSFINRRFI